MKNQHQNIQALAKDYCESQKQRYTDPRKYVFDIIASAPKPLGAYDVLEKLGQYIDNPKPPTAYRAIDFWVEHGFVHKIESLNAFVACHAGHNHVGSQYMICENCHDVEEIHLCSMPPKLSEKIAEKGFQQHYWNVEIHGICQQCTKKD